MLQGNGQFYFVILLLFIFRDLDDFSYLEGFQACGGCRKLIEMQIWVTIQQDSWDWSRKTEKEESKTEKGLSWNVSRDVRVMGQISLVCSPLEI